MSSHTIERTITPHAARSAVTYRNRGLVTQVLTVLTQPIFFFRSFPGGRQWLWIAMLILVVIGFNAVQLAAIDQATPPPMPLDGPMGPDMGAFSGGDMGMPPMPPPDGGGMPGGSPAGGNTGIAQAWVMALRAATGQLVLWAFVAFLLGVVSMFHGQRPSYSLGVQIAVWSALPLVIMALLQLIYLSMGGTVGSAGISGLVVEQPFYEQADAFVQALLRSAASVLTIFAVWHVILVYLGARHTLDGRRWIVAPVVGLYILVIVLLPALADYAANGGAEADLPPLLELPADEMPGFEQGMFGEMPSGDMPYYDGPSGIEDSSLPAMDSAPQSRPAPVIRSEVRPVAPPPVVREERQ